jgi:NAD kinase
MASHDLDRKIILVVRRTRLQELVARYNTVEQAKFQAEHLGLDFSDFLLEDQQYQLALKLTSSQLELHGRMQMLDRGFLPNFMFPKDALVVVLGQDGLVANTLKYLDGQSVLALNPDPKRWDGKLLPFEPKALAGLLPEVLGNKRPTKEIVFGMATLSDGQKLLAVNDFYVGTRSHVSSRYQITSGEIHEQHSSSGIIISTGLGSTGWLRSVLTGASVIAGGANKRATQLRESGFAWDSERLVFSVREPFPSVSSQANCVFGDVSPQKPLIIRSLMPEGGVIFSDGMESDGLEFRSGLEAVINIAEQRGRLLN